MLPQQRLASDGSIDKDTTFPNHDYDNVGLQSLPDTQTEIVQKEVAGTSDDELIHSSMVVVPYAGDGNKNSNASIEGRLYNLNKITVRPEITIYRLETSINNLSHYIIHEWHRALQCSAVVSPFRVAVTSAAQSGATGAGNPHTADLSECDGRW